MERQPDVIEEERELIDTERSDAFCDRSAQKISRERAVRCAAQDLIGFSGAVRMIRHALRVRISDHETERDHMLTRTHVMEEQFQCVLSVTRA